MSSGGKQDVPTEFILPHRWIIEKSMSDSMLDNRPIYLYPFPSFQNNVILRGERERESEEKEKS